MNKKEEALENFKTKYNCSQTVLDVFCEELGLDKETAKKLSIGFGGGALRGELCGTVSAGIMVLGLKYGDGAKPYIDEFESRMEELYGSIRCENMLGFNVSHKQGPTEEVRHELKSSICPEIVKDAVDILEELLRG